MMPTLQQFMQQRLLADMLARGVQVPQLGGQQPRLPVQPATMPVGGQAPPYWPGAQPMPQQAPITPGINPSVPIPGITVQPGMTSGATTSPIVEKSRVQKILEALQRPDIAAFLQHAGMGIGGPRMPGESQMQQITRGIAQGYGGMRSAQQEQQQRQMLDWQRTMQEREQGRKEAETAAQAQTSARQVGAYEKQVETSGALGREAHAIEREKLGAETGWRNQELAIQRDIASNNKAEADKKITVMEGQLAAENRKIAELEKSGAAERDLNPRKVAVMELEAKAALLRAQAALAEQKRIAEDSKDPELKMIVDLAGKFVMAQYAGSQQMIENKVGGQAGVAQARGTINVQQAIQDATTVVKSAKEVRSAGNQQPPPSGDWKAGLVTAKNKAGKVIYLLNGVWVDENKAPVR